MCNASWKPVEISFKCEKAYVTIVVGSCIFIVGS